MAKKYVYFYGGGKKMTDGDRSMRELLGGKGANLAEMSNAGVPVPPGFTVSTEACGIYEKEGAYPKEMMQQVKKELAKLEKLEGQKPVSYTHLTLRRYAVCRSRWSPYH